ncbi:hypothetical protein Tco_0932354 [Tanacetum coccineum]
MIEDRELKVEALNNKRLLEESMNEKEESSDDERGLDSPVDEREDYEHTTNIETDVDSKYNPYLDISRLFNDYTTKDEDEIIQDEVEMNNDEDDDMRHLDDHLVHKNEPFIINKKEERFDEQRCNPLGTPLTRPPTGKTERSQYSVSWFTDMAYRLPKFVDAF